jgi:hypothetical protein
MLAIHQIITTLIAYKFRVTDSPRLIKQNQRCDCNPNTTPTATTAFTNVGIETPLSGVP